MAACADDGPQRASEPVAVAGPVAVAEPFAFVEPVAVVAVASQRCHRPTVHRGVGTDLGRGHTLTAAHLVDGDLRELTVGGRPAEVVALSVELDLALLITDGALTTERPTPPNGGARPSPGPATVLGLAGPVPATVDAVITLRVRDLSEQVRHERPALRLSGAVERGDSGSPVIDGHGRLIGVIVLTDPVGGVTYASRVPDDIAELPAWSLRRGCPDG